MTIRPIKTNPPVTSEMSPVELGGGLDFTTSKLKAEPGTLIDCLNFEVVDREGYKRIDGFEPYDGQTIMDEVDNLYVIEGAFEGVIDPEDLYEGALLGKYTGNINDGFDFVGVFGTVLNGATVTFNDPEPGFSTCVIPFILTNASFLPEASPLPPTISTDVDSIHTEVSPEDFLSATSIGIVATSLTQSYTRDGLNSYFDDRRSDITALENRPLGLHWFRDRLYAVAEDYLVHFTSGGTTELLENQFIGNALGDQGRVLTIVLESGTWAGGDAQGYIQIEKYSDGPWQIATVNTYTDDTFMTTIDTDVFLAYDADGVTPINQKATLWQARSQAQADAESATVGWSRIDPGWSVEFSDGTSPDGIFTKITKGVDPNFTPATSSTPVTSTNGTPNLLDQAVNVLNENQQAQGWKSTADEAVFASDADAVNADDGTFLYGDAQGFWNVAGGGAVYTNQPSGGAGQTSTAILQAYPPENVLLEFTSPGSYDTYIYSSNGYAYFLLSGFQNLGVNIPENSTITGIEVTCKYDAEVLFRGQSLSDAQIWAAFTSVTLESQIMEHDADENTAIKKGSAKQAAMDFTLGNFTETHRDTGPPLEVRWTKDSESTVTFGAAGDLWGLSKIGRTELIDDTFALGFRMRVECGTTSAGGGDNAIFYRPLLEDIRIKVYYSTPAVRLWFTDTGKSHIIQGDLVYYDVTEGSLIGGDAVGTLQVINVELVSGDLYNIQDNMTVHTGSTPTDGNQIAVVTADMTYNGLPGLDQLFESNSRYQFITANFYSLDDQDGFYGVSGADKAFSLNTYEDSSVNYPYMVKITTNSLDEGGDKPRHVAFHHYHLALGFQSGIVRFSVPGEPENFDGVQGASEIGIGDRVTGMLSLRGTTLGVFCENSIWGIAGTVSDEFQTQVLDPDQGAIEYTVENLRYPIFCTPRGIFRLGDEDSLSKRVSPWVLPRMRRDTALNDALNLNSVVGAMINREKNQYRVFFKDGSWLFCTLNPDQPPSFTFAKYYIGQTSVSDVNGNALVPMGWSTEIDERGRERTHVCTYSPFETFSDGEQLFVYELERGWGFAGRFIPAYFATNWQTVNPYQEKTLQQIRVDGLTLGYGSAEMSLAKDYEEVYTTVKEPCSLPRTAFDTIEYDFKPASRQASSPKTGRSLSVKIEEVIPDGDAITDPTPPVIYQTLLSQYKSSGRTDS